MEKIWADWEVVKLLGEGSFGKVYEVVRNRFGIEERSAVKVITIPSTPSEANSLRSEGMTDGDITAYYKGLVQDFVQEIALMSQLRGHSNIVGYEDYEVIEHTDRFGWDIYIRMELLTPLTSRMENGVMAMTEQEAVRMAIDISTALEECYDKRIVHRDIKPDNIFIGKNGEYKLGDFGVARTVEKTISGLSKKGTYTYMAPEIYKGEPGGMNSDVYSLGMVLYRVLNDGREPFTPYAPAPIGYEDKQKALARRMNGEAFPQPRCASAEVTQIINKACAYHPAARYQTPTQ
ncbi:MAG: serine/threonine protein kinase, partial [Clostridia bacterium]|nr:serine/threonine protein kinase [Clostridia bacterium]